MSTIFDNMLEKVMNWVNSWGLWKMIHDEILIRESSVEIEYKDGHKEMIYLDIDA
ncbi:MAG: hypothetical protein Lokiarch_13090 [Candidatus Lokiarchaeum sp. GC14_75]|nr:MAG: hypothetical protein Lokiarch_13090 [Candidatus Lokiarchaeum sp. GC14_75]